MDIFNYPLDTNLIMRKKKSIKRQLLQNKMFISKKLAILGGSTTSDIKDILELFLLNEGIKVELYESEYNKYFEDALYSKELEEFNPDIIYICINYRNIESLPNVRNSKDLNTQLLNYEYNKFETIWKTLESKFNCLIIQNNFDYPKNRNLGNMERTFHGGIINFIDKLNARFSEYTEVNKLFYINDINYLSASIGLEKWEDLNMWYGYKYAISFEAMPYLAKSVNNIIKAIYGKVKKGLVLDLDNTLWGGVIGDDGVNNLQIGPETAIGEAYSALQLYIRNLKERGITLAISSKNDENIANEGLNHPNMILKRDDFFSVKANWEPKFLNIEKIANEINIGIDSLVFLDDNPVEREIVEKNLRGIAVPNIGEEIIKYIDHIDKNGYFEVVSISNEDIKRDEYYKKNEERKKLEYQFKDYNEFLTSLEMIANIQQLKPVYFDRIAQLTNKTNQFNLTTKRYSLAEIESIYNDENKVCIYGRLKDKFGDNGLISIIIGTIINEVLEVDLWIMSCRVLKRDMEKAMFDKLISICKDKNIRQIKGFYFKTNKNAMVENHYLDLGFNLVKKSETESIWVLEVGKMKKKLNNVITEGDY